MRALASLLCSCIAFASAAYAASVVVVPVQSAGDVFIKYAWVVFISLAGWAVNSLPVIADWGAGTTRRKLVIVQGIIQALFFGVIAFWGASGANQNIMACYLAAATAAWGGDRYLTFGRKDLGEPKQPAAE